jgi:hypothetical protein
MGWPKMSKWQKVLRMAGKTYYSADSFLYSKSMVLSSSDTHAHSTIHGNGRKYNAQEAMKDYSEAFSCLMRHCTFHGPNHDSLPGSYNPKVSHIDSID